MGLGNDKQSNAHSAVFVVCQLFDSLHNCLSETVDPSTIDFRHHCPNILMAPASSLEMCPLFVDSSVGRFHPTSRDQSATTALGSKFKVGNPMPYGLMQNGAY